MERNKNILLISLQADLTILGLKHLHYYLLQNGYNSHFLVLPEFDPSRPRGLEKLREFVARVNPILIGVSLMSVEFSRARELCADLKRRFPAIPIIWGGVHPTVAPETCFPPADYVCIGEGQQSLLDFARALSNGEDLRGTNNLCYPEAGWIQRNPLYPLIEDLDALPLGDHIPKNGFIQDGRGEIRVMDREMFRRYGRYQDRFYDIMTSLGCQLSCTYCTSPFLSGLYGSRHVRKRSLQNIMLELERTVRENPYLETINFQDENFLTYDLEFFQKFKVEYLARVKRPLIMACTPVWVTREKIALLREAGLIWIRMGIQSGSDRVLKEIYHRNSFSRHFLEAAKIFSEFKVMTYNDLIVDNPLETETDQLETIRVLIQRPRPYYLQMFSLTPFYGTRLAEMIREQCPQGYADPTRDYFEYRKTPLNAMIRLTPFVPRRMLNRLVEEYRRNPRSVSFRIRLAAANILGLFIFEPINFFRLLKLSQGGSWKGIFRSLLLYRKIWFQRYSKHFHKPKPAQGMDAAG